MQDSFAWRARSAVFIIAESCDLVGHDDAMLQEREKGEKRKKPRLPIHLLDEHLSSDRYFALIQNKGTDNYLSKPPR